MNRLTRFPRPAAQFPGHPCALHGYLAGEDAHAPNASLRIKMNAVAAGRRAGGISATGNPGICYHAAMTESQVIATWIAFLVTALRQATGWRENRSFTR